METVILDGLLKEATAALAGFAYNEIAKVLGVKHEIIKLERKLKTIAGQLSTAPYHTIIPHAEGNHEWLKQLTEIAYEAESIIDRFKIEVGMLQLQVCRCCREVNTRCRAAKRLEKLNKRLDDLEASSELNQRALQALATMYQRPESSSEEIGPCHGGEPNDSVGSIISNDCDDHVRRMRGNSISLFAIVGAPGVGKTTLAQKIYHKMREDPQFRRRMWVHISSSTGKMTIWSGENPDDAASNSEPRQQKEIIRRHLAGSNLLLVIDNVRDKEGWEFLGELGEGFLERDVRVILTASRRDRTRIIGVNRWFGCHHVRALDEDDGWLLLRRTAQLREHEAVGKFQNAGIRIVSKCSGLPLALKAVGSSLRQQDQLGPWMAELSADLFGTQVMQREIQRSIDTSYMELGYRLKLCFLYCSLYPEGSVIQQKSIMQQWIAEGFFEKGSSGTTEEQQGTCPEEVEAQNCYTELVDRSLLLPAADGCATMPNLLRSYAIYRSQDENYVGDPRNIGRAFKVWRLYAADGGKIRDIPNDVTSLRTLLVFGSSSPQGDTSTNATPPVMDIICKRFTSLRVLDLRDGQVDSVGSNLGQLLQLRYLNLSNTSIRRLPHGVSNLVMLQYLILNNCRHLNSLPSGVGRLKNLRTLDISETPGLQEIRFRLRNLKELNCFRGFLPVPNSLVPVSSSSASTGWTFKELSNLSKLTSLQILNLGSGTSRQEAAELRLHEMGHLKELELFCTIPADHEQPPAGGDVESIGDVLGELKPPGHLTSLKLAKFYGNEFPSWVSSSHLTSLEQLTLDGCSQCQRLPPSLCDMMDLNFLTISGCSALCEITHEFQGAPINLVAFRRLEQLIVAEMESLQTWSGLLEGDMPLLRSFHVSRCPRLSKLPPWLIHCKALTSMKIHLADKLLEIRGLPALKELQVDSCRALQLISELGRLEDLEVTACPGLDAVEDVPLLRSLRLREDASSKELPRWLPRLPVRLRRLEILGGEDLLDSCSSEHAPSWPSIKDIADLVHAKVVHDGSAYFSCITSTSTSPPRFHRISLQCRDRAKAYGSTVQTLPPPQEAKAWVWRALYGLAAAFLIGSAVILSTSGTRSSANGSIAA
ncbi:hypothetical protein SEVIR_2G177900v4 [Setaria viridis]|uniref:AAA+ ATPase domain-containing protein n=1 Tax=Setaria viridis TaxID=4556 RepID=A0A4U6VX55_SETVI|nr:putative disease resistance protein RGA3 [Setaria viridis]TKW32599.1 hypothetical protein SEVIR_2G177900v2 [Setaria viridis]